MQGVSTVRQKHTFEADMRYSGQALSLPVAFSLEALQTDGLDVLAKRFVLPSFVLRIFLIGSSFTSLHHSLFTYSLDLRVEIINLRSRAEEILEDIILKNLGKSDGGVPTHRALTSRTEAYWNGNTYPNVPIWERTLLRDGDAITGPAIITEVFPFVSIRTPSDRITDGLKHNCNARPPRRDRWLW